MAPDIQLLAVVICHQPYITADSGPTNRKEVCFLQRIKNFYQMTNKNSDKTVCDRVFEYFKNPLRMTPASSRLWPQFALQVQQQVFHRRT